MLLPDSVVQQALHLVDAGSITRVGCGARCLYEATI